MIAATGIYILVAACLPKNKETTSSRTASEICAVAPGACDGRSPLSYVQGIAGTVATLDPAKGFSNREPVNLDESTDPQDQVVIVGNSTPPEAMRFRRVTSGKMISGHFLRGIVDTDKVLTQDITMGPAAVSILKTGKARIQSGDLMLIRAGVALETARENRAVCSGLVASLQLRVDASLAPLGSESFKMDAPSRRRTLTISSLVRVTGDGEIPFEVVVTGDKPSCAATILEPATLTVIVFSEVSSLDQHKSAARFLERVIESDKPDNAAPVRITTSPSGPPIVTLASLDWQHGRLDTALVMASVETTAEDRLDETTSWLQLTRAPTAISSHLNTLSLTATQGTMQQGIFDWSTAPSQEGTTKFYLVTMGTGENSKPLSLAKPSIRLMHFRPAWPDSAIPVALTSVTDNAAAKSGRALELFDLRARLPREDVPLAEDSLPCQLFKAGSVAIPGLPEGVKIPTPVHHHFRTRWQANRIQFPVVLYENIYHQAPVWAFTPPAGRSALYTERFYEVSVANPGSPNCSFAAQRK